MMYAPRSEPALRNFEPAPFTQQNVGCGHADILESNFAMPVRRVIITEDRQHAADGDARSVERNKNHGLLFMARSRGVGLAHENGDFAARIAGARRPPLAAVEDVIAALAHDA